MREVEYEAVLLARVRRKTRSTPAHLQEKPRAHGGTEKRDAVDVRRVESRRQALDVAHVLERPLRPSEEVRLDRAALEAVEDIRTFLA